MPQDDDVVVPASEVLDRPATGSVRVGRKELLKMVGKATAVGSVLQLDQSILVLTIGSDWITMNSGGASQLGVEPPRLSADVRGLPIGWRAPVQSRYLRDAVDSFTTDTVVLSVTSDGQPMIISSHDASYRHVIMLMKNHNARQA